MSDSSKIEWTDATWNCITGCTRVSEGCRNCYAERLAATRLAHVPAYEGVAEMTPAGPRWTGLVRFNADRLALPLRWQRPRRVFVNSQSDLFHESLDFEQIAAIFGVMAACPRHAFQVLTKRPERMRAWLEWIGHDPIGRLILCMGRHGSPECHKRWPTKWPAFWPLRNVHLGVSVEDQATADARIPVLLECPAAVRWVSAEPLLGPVDLALWLRASEPCAAGCGCEYATDPDGRECSCAGPCATSDVWPSGPRLNWVVVGGESGPGARPMHPDWARSLRDQCATAGVSFLFKQHGEWAPFESLSPDLQHRLRVPSELTGEPFEPATLYRVGKRAAGRLLDGRTWDEYPATSQPPEARHA